jgi:hypothetical protein
LKLSSNFLFPFHQPSGLLGQPTDPPQQASRPTGAAPPLLFPFLLPLRRLGFTAVAPCQPPPTSRAMEGIQPIRPIYRHHPPFPAASASLPDPIKRPREHAHSTPHLFPPSAPSPLHRNATPGSLSSRRWSTPSPGLLHCLVASIRPM